MGLLILFSIVTLTILCTLVSMAVPALIWALLILVPMMFVAVIDITQSEHSLRRNYPVFGRMRWIAEMLRPFVRQYFIESETESAPISRMHRNIVYQRAKGDVDTTPYGTKLDLYEDGYEWLGHSLAATNVEEGHHDPRVTIGGDDCTQPYSASILNISAMSYGALSNNAIAALNKGARAGNFYHNSGEGGLSPYHLENGGDLIWQIGTGYFGCRTSEGRFDPAKFEQSAQLPQVKMIEIKLSQGAKPGHGGILPASKNTPEIARIRTVEVGTEVVSPSRHPEFDTPIGLLEFVKQLRILSGGKPVGFKLCIGRRTEFVGICKAMVKTGILPDFITVDGGEGGTGAAPLEYSNSVGMPLRDALAFVDDCLTGYGVRDKIKIIAAGKILTSFHLAKNLALGADLCNSARGMMLALGCVQSLECHTNRCPTGVATQDPKLARGLVVEDKYERVRRFHAEMIHALVDLISSMGIQHPNQLQRNHIFRRVNQFQVMRYDQIFPEVEPGSIVNGQCPEHLAELVERGTAEAF